MPAALRRIVGFATFHVLRILDDWVPLGLLRGVLLPWAALRGLFPTPSLRGKHPWPRCLGSDPGRRSISWRQSIRHHMDRLPAFLPDRLSEPRWRDRCEVAGLERLEAARRAGRPVVLGFCHFGPFGLIASWLRARGYPTIPLVAGMARNRPYHHRLRDRCMPFPEVPGALYTDQLREVTELGSNASLLVALDVRAGRTVTVPVTEGWAFCLATGAIRIAAQKQGLLLPCSMVSLGGWRFRLVLGRPVPEEFLGPVPDLERAAAHLVAELFPFHQAHPDQCRRELIGSFREAPIPASPPGESPRSLPLPADLQASQTKMATEDSELTTTSHADP